ncbi:MAG: hypothetical protein WAU61_11565 [Smithella sp.]
MSNNFFNALVYCIDWTAIGTMIIAIGTFIVAYIAYTQLQKGYLISQADFDQRFKNDFFKEKTQQLFMLFQYDLIKFKVKPVINTNDEFPYFEVDRTKLDANPIFSTYLPENKYSYSPYEIDELLLGHFEDLGFFCKKGLIDIEFIYEGFSYYIEAIHKNEQIQDYIKWTREKEDEDADEREDEFANFDFIFDKVICYEK